MKSAHSLGVLFGPRPLGGEREKRLRRRQLLGVALVLLLAGFAVGMTLLLRSPSNPGAGGPAPSGALRQYYRSPKGWSMRPAHGMQVEHASGSGISYAVDEVTFASFRPTAGVLVRSYPRGETIRTVPPRARSGRFPAGGIAVRFLWQAGPVPGLVQQPATRLPLRLSSFRPVSSFRFYDFYPRTHPRPLQHLLVSSWGQRYFVQVWIGPNASARQRGLLARMIASIAVRQPQSRS